MNKHELLETLFAAFPSSHPTEQTFNVYLETLESVSADELSVAVKQLIREGGAFPPSVGDLMKAITRAPGPRSDVDPHTLKPVPTTFFRLPEDEDRRERLERLRQTKDWGRYYG